MTPFAYAYGRRDNRDEPNTNTVTSEKPEDELESHSADDSNGGQPESSATAAKRRAPQKPPNSPYAPNLRYSSYIPYSEG